MGEKKASRRGGAACHDDGRFRLIGGFPGSAGAFLLNVPVRFAAGFRFATGFRFAAGHLVGAGIDADLTERGELT